MAERKAAGFNIPLNFYDGPEVNSIPARIRAAAIGVWALAGDYAATGLTDGHVPAGVLKSLGCTPKIRASLMVTVNKKGDLSPLWIDGRDGGVLLTNWPKHQRTNDEVSAYREAEAERKRVARAAKRKQREISDTDGIRPKLSLNRDEVKPQELINNGLIDDPPEASTSTDREMSGRTPTGRPGGVRSTKTKTETEKEISTYVGAEQHLGSAQAATPGADLVREIIPKEHPHATLTMLRLQASELINTGTDPEIVAAGLRLWADKPSVGIGRTILASMCSEVIKSRNPPTAPTAPAANGRRPTTDERVARVLAMKTPTDTKELE